MIDEKPEKLIIYINPPYAEAGDSSELIASSALVKMMLGWTPKITSLETIIETAWNWHKNHPNGYNDK